MNIVLTPPLKKLLFAIDGRPLQKNTTGQNAENK